MSHLDTRILESIGQGQVSNERDCRNTVSLPRHYRHSNDLAMLTKQSDRQTDPRMASDEDVYAKRFIDRRPSNV